MADDARTSRRPRGLSVRLQLTLSYAALLVLVGLALLIVGLLILRFIPEGNLTVVGGTFAPGRDDLTDVYVRYSLAALAALAVIGLGGGWLLAGRMLRPLTRITEVARRVRDGHLEQRVAMPGRQNELAELADTLDGMLGRLQRSLDEQRRFAANASHELRTPHAVMRTMLEVARADPTGRDVDVLLQRLDETNERSIVLIEALLVLAEIDHREPALTSIDLDVVAREVVDELRPSAERAAVALTCDAAAGVVQADPALLRQLIANLVQNAIAYNRPGGDVRVSTVSTASGPVLEVQNSGEMLDPAVVDTLTEPFVRPQGRTRRRGDGASGSGLGLAIVSSIARAHGAALTLRARDEGGLAVRVLFNG